MPLDQAPERSSGATAPKARIRNGAAGLRPSVPLANGGERPVYPHSAQFCTAIHRKKKEQKERPTAGYGSIPSVTFLNELTRAEPPEE
jgi:hypothetical protein